MLLKVKNLLDQQAISTNLTQQEVVGVGTIHVQNANGFNANWGIQVGRTGEERSEILVLSAAAPSGTSLVLSGTNVYSHATDSPVYAIKWNQIIFKRSTAGTAGTASGFATVTITPDQPYTQYDDTTGLSTYAYKSSFYNSALAVESSDSDWITSSGYDFYSLAKIRQRIKDKLFSTGYIGDDSVIDDWINEYYEMMTNTAIEVNQDYALGSTNVSYSGTTELGTITAADFKQVRRIWMTNDAVNYYPATKMEVTSVSPNQIFNQTNPFYFMYNENVISRWPHDQAGTAALVYYKYNTVLSNETDSLPVYMRGYTKGFVDYGLAMAKGKDNKPDEKIALENSAMATLDKFKREATPRSKSGPQTIEIVESIGEDISPYS